VKRVICALWLLLVATAAPVKVPPAPAIPPTPHSIAPLAAMIDNADARIQSVAAAARSPRVDDVRLREGLGEISEVQDQLNAALAALQPRMQSADARLAQLGSAPAAEQPAEDPEVTQERSNILRFRGAVDTELKLGHLISVEAQQLQTSLTIQRKTIFTKHLWRRDLSALNPELWSAVAATAGADVQRVTGLLNPSPASTTSGIAFPSGLRWVFGLVAALAIAIPLRIFLVRTATRRAQKANATTLGRAVLALAIVIISVVTTLVACLVARATFSNNFGSPLYAHLASLTLRALVFASFFAGIGRALIAARAPEWRLAPLSDETALRVRPFPTLLGLAAALATVVDGAIQSLAIGEASGALLRSLILIIEIAAIGGTLLAVREDSVSLDSGTSGMDSPVSSERSRLPWIIAALCGWVVIATGLVAMLLGYIALAEFLIGETIWIGTMLALLFLLVRFVDDGFPALVAPHGRAGMFLRRSLGLSPAALEQFGVLIAGAARIALLLFGWTAILAPLGAGAGDVLARLTSTELIFHLGQVAISPGTIVGGALVFAIAIAITRSVRRWLEARYLPKTAMDIGARAALSSGVGYVGVIVAIIIAASYLGLSLDRITLFASALSVGIGFGLQSVISNFVSGLILLAERPVKVGDWIAIGDLEGDVRRISVRATEIEMRDRSKLIVPNSDLISKTVRNVTHGSSLGRIKIVLLVVDATDPAQMQKLLLDTLSAHPDTRSDPPVNVFLTDVRDGALEFTSFAYVSSPRDAYRVRSDLMFQIVPLLKASGIALASTTPVVNVGLADRPMEPASNPSTDGGNTEVKMK
jgi:potassium efflux system protein